MITKAFLDDFIKCFEQCKDLDFEWVTDLVTIADCTDAATDILGRNYAEGKTFETVLQEFIRGAGTRYNPDIVECIKNDGELIGKLTELTTESRMEIYKKVYSRYIK